MEELIARVCKAASLDDATALTAVGHVIRFLRDHAPQSGVSAFLDKVPFANQAIEAAVATDDAGVTAALGAVKGLFGFGHIDTNILDGKLGNLGLNEGQMRALLKEVFVYAESLIGAEGVAKISAAVPHLTEFMGRTA